ncbi:hypothetical protein PF003_g19369 [Phytophthora fragariae]|nr:hypothetical protein PF003_g19369 [Phytophthora fragariae]
MRNYSAKVDLPKVTLTPSYSDVFTALRVLNSYGHEFFDATTCRLLTAAQDFAEELDDYGPWSTTEVHALAFWFSRVLGAYRIAAAHDAEQYTRTTNKSGELVQTWQLAFQHRVCTRGLVVSRATVATAPVVSHPHRGTPPASHLRFLARPPRVRLQGAPPQHSDGEGNALVTYALTKLWSHSTSIGCCMATTTASCFLLQIPGVIREGQEAGTYLVLDRDVAQRWRELHYSPFGSVPKADTDPAHEARVIHDLSFPAGESVNDLSDPDKLPPLVYESIGAIARRIETLKQRSPATSVKLMRGDVKWAFKHVHGYSSVCVKFAGVLPEENAVAIDLALPFGWTRSPTHYAVFGSAISFLVRRESPSSLCPTDSDFCFEWVDDHVLIEEDVANRLELCECALRLAMFALSRFPDRKSPFTQAAAAPTPRRDNSSFSGQRPQQSADKPGPRRSVPLAVAKAAPHLDGKQLYLRYISAQDCPSQSPDRCTHHFLVHFTPSTLKPAVKSYIVEKYGGLRADLLT